MPRIRSLFLGAAAAFVLAACTTHEQAVKTPPPPPPPPPPNIFAQPSPLPFHAPDFAKIKDSDFVPAMDEGMKKQIAEVEAIADNPAPPTFENTVAAMEKTGRELTRATKVFFALAQANTDPTLQKIQAEMAPRLSAHHDAIYLNARLFARVKALHDERAHLDLGPEESTLLQVYYHDFVSSGALLSNADKARLRSINKHLATLQTTYDSKLLAATKAGALVVNNPAKLKGLGKAGVAAAALAAKGRGLKGKWVIPLQNTTQQPALSLLDNRAVRHKFFENSWNRTELGNANDTRNTIATIAKLRAEKAALLGYPNYASYVLVDQMAKTPAAVEKFLAKLVPASVAKAHAEERIIQRQIRRTHHHFKLQPWDWERYAEMVRKARYRIDDKELKPYFVLNNVLEKGLFYMANQLYGLTFKERHDIPVYQPDVRVFEVIDADGSPLGLIYFDYFKRDNKAGGAWMDTFVDQSKVLGTKPVVYNVCNFTKPAPGEPALLTLDDVTTMFHEFGHALHGLFASQKYPSVSGTAVARDFVEFPSQFDENWALYPKVLEHYAINYKTGKPIPLSLVKRIKKARNWNQGYSMVERLAASQLDMQWHLLPASAPKQNVDKFETQALKKTHLLLRDVPPRYRSSYFTHIWTLGYASGYYAYAWSEMLDHDAFAWFMKHGGMTRANGQRFRDLILSRGHTEDYGKMFRAFYGRNPDIGPMLKFYGFPQRKH